MDGMWDSERSFPEAGPPKPGTQARVAVAPSLHNSECHKFESSFPSNTSRGIGWGSNNVTLEVCQQEGRMHAGKAYWLPSGNEALYV